MARYFYTIKVTKDMDKFGLIKGSRLTDTTSIYDPLKASFFSSLAQVKAFLEADFGEEYKESLKGFIKIEIFKKVPMGSLDLKELP